MIEKSKNSLESAIDGFLDKPTTQEQSQPEMDCSSGTCVIKNDKSIVERLNKKIITEDGRQLLI